MHAAFRFISERPRQIQLYRSHGRIPADAEAGAFFNVKVRKAPHGVPGVCKNGAPPAARHPVLIFERPRHKFRSPDELPLIVPRRNLLIPVPPNTLVAPRKKRFLGRHLIQVVGGNDAEIVLIGREAGSGTRDGFESITGTKDACQYRQELTSTGDVITTVSQNPDAIGYASLAALKDTVKALTVGGVAPTEETVKDGSYVIQRPFVLVTKTGETLSDNAQKFFDFALSAEAAQYITTAGAVPVNG